MKPDLDPPDLDTPDRIAEMVRRFYRDVAQDDLLGPVFNDVAQVDWAEHLPNLTAFWCRILLSMPGYTGNPLRSHAEVHQRCAFTPAMFARWLRIFGETLEGAWSGPRTDRALEFAHTVARAHCRQLTGEPLEA